jgi:hypothetical protein
MCPTILSLIFIFKTFSQTWWYQTVTQALGRLGYTVKLSLKKKKKAGHQQCMPVIPATQEAEIRRIKVQSQS